MEPLKRFFAAPLFQHDPEKTLRARQVNIFANWGMVSMLIFALLELFARPIDLLLSETVLILTAAILYGLGRLSYHIKTYPCLSRPACPVGLGWVSPIGMRTPGNQNPPGSAGV
jgi:hypothetical protein